MSALAVQVALADPVLLDFSEAIQTLLVLSSGGGGSDALVVDVVSDLRAEFERKPLTNLTPPGDHTLLALGEVAQLSPWAVPVLYARAAVGRFGVCGFVFFPSVCEGRALSG